mmetsp:Transcript_39225/g.70347  ORF Transcript_39225/g.70347 Transcript_39225/m.70347 type:complete len:91 (-) Transcript_39225:47-319(-)
MCFLPKVFLCAEQIAVDVDFAQTGHLSVVQCARQERASRTVSPIIVSIEMISTQYDPPRVHLNHSESTLAAEPFGSSFFLFLQSGKAKSR